MQKGFTPVVLLLLLAVIGGVTIGAFYLGQQINKPIKPSQQPPASSPTQQQALSPTPASKADANHTPSGSVATANWKMYTIKAVKLQLKLPPQLTKEGDLQESLENGQQGTLFCSKIKAKSLSLITSVFAGGSNCYPVGNDKFVLGGISKDYAAGREGIFVDHSGYSVRDGKYYVKFTLNKEDEFSSDEAKEIKTPNGISALIIKGKNVKSEAYPEGYPLFGTLGDGWIGATVNTNDSTYPGVVTQMKLTSDLTEL